jgi:aspartate-semialdehyde dehydrogenase
MTRPVKPSNLFSVALVGGASLKGREVRDVLTERNFPSVEVKLLDDEEALGQLEQLNDELTFIQGVLPEHLEGIDFAFLTADAAFIERVWTSVRNSGSEIIDLSYALENNTDAVLRAPWFEREIGRTREVELKSSPVVTAHPVAVVLALLLWRVQKAAPVELASAVISQPASEYGRRGMDELHEQTVNLLSLQSLPTTFFGTQVAFNLFVRPVEAAQPTLAQSEARILRHFRAITQGGIPAPALLLQQTPVFHGFAIALFVKTGSDITAAKLEAALAGPHVVLAGGQEEFPNNMNIAGSSEIQVSVQSDGAGGNGFWLFAVCDNLRVSAIQAVECAEEMVRTRPRGELQ